MKTPQDFIAFFEAIPEDQWTTENYEDLHGRKCANGHLFGIEGACQTFEALLGRIAEPINDGDLPEYPQPTPKQRILAALHDLIK